MQDRLKTFLIDAERKAFDLEHRRKIHFNISRYDATVLKGLKQYSNLELASQIAKNTKWKAIANLDKMLLTFESNFIKRGGKVIWAYDDKEALDEIFKILRNKNTKSVVKSKSMATEEIGLNEALEANNIEVNETDLGEYIVQLAGEKPYHILTPAMHKSRQDVLELFHEKLGTPMDLTPEELTGVARERLRQKYITSEVGISGANFIIADTGSIALTENEGNARLTTTFPKTHIVLVGIEKIIPSISDLGLYWPLLATLGTGQFLTVYNSIFSGPKLDDEVDGPEEMYVILLDNGRTNLLAKKEQREALYCIRCGACVNACPIYKNIGGHSYNTTYSGPIGSVITPNMRGMKEFKHLSFASSLCGNCTEVCPVKINLHELLLINRRDAVNQGFVNGSEKMAMSFWKKGMLRRSRLNMLNHTFKNMVYRYFLKKLWGKRREMPKMPSKSFNQVWREQHKTK